MKRIKIYLTIVAVSILAFRCSNEGINVNDSALKQTAIDIAQTSGQLASGTSYSITGSSTDSTNCVNEHHHFNGDKGHDRHHGILDGLNLLAPTNELLAIIDAESASDIRGLRISKNGGATITNYNSSGEVVTFSLGKGDGPQGCSFSGKQFPEFDSLLSTIVKTVVDFGTGTTYKRDTVEISRSGKVVINRTVSGNTTTEVVTFENYSVNGIQIEGTKTRVSIYDSTTGSGSSTTTVIGGKITFEDGTTAAWISDKSRNSTITLEATTGRPIKGTINTTVNTQVTASDGTVIYSHKTTSPLVENLACVDRRKGPVSGTLETIYRENTVVADYGDGTCTNKTVTITFNGVTTTRTIGG